MPGVACDVALVELVVAPVVVVAELELGLDGLDADELVALDEGLDAGADEFEDGAVEDCPVPECVEPGFEPASGSMYC